MGNRKEIGAKLVKNFYKITIVNSVQFNLDIKENYFFD